MPPHLNALYTLFPFLRWLQRYPRRWLGPDIFAGLTLSFVVLPQSIAFAIIAGLPVEYGIYAAMIPPIIAGLYGTSSHLVTGPTNAMAIVVASILAPLLATGYGVEIVLVLALMVGVFQLLIGVFRMGFIMDFISRSVILGFTAGAALSIGLKQIKYALGIQIDDSGLFYQTLLNAAKSLPEVNVFSLGITAGTMLIIYNLDKIFRRIPAGLIALLIAVFVSYIFNLPDLGVATVGSMQTAIPRFGIPSFSITLFQDLVVPALALALLGLISSVSISRSIAIQSHQILKNDREVVGQGLANIFAGVFQAMPVAGSFSLSNTAWRIGAKSSLTAVFMGIAMFLIIKVFAPAAPYLPLPAIAGMLFMIIPKMIRFQDLKASVLATHADAAVVFATFAATLFIKLEFAVYVGIFLSIFLHLAKTSHPKITPVLPKKPGWRMEEDKEDHPCPQMAVVKLEGSLFFGSAEYTKNHLLLYLDNHPSMKHFILRLEGVEVLDASGIASIEELHEKLLSRGGHLALAGCSAAHVEILANAGFLQKIGSDYIRRSTEDAIKQLMETFNYVKCYQCPHFHFLECKGFKKEGKAKMESEKNET